MNGHDGSGAWIPRDQKAAVPIDLHPHLTIWGGNGPAALLDSKPSLSAGSSPRTDGAVIAALEAYLEALCAGRPCSRDEFLARHPEIADALLECLSGLEFIQTAAVQLGDSSTDRPDLRSDPVPPSAQLGDYRILREVGRGGMGVVYEAEQISLGRRVALKVLPFAAAIDPKQRQRFQIEAQAAAQLHHPHIVPIFGVGCDQGIHYYAMQFVEGRSMAAIVRELRSCDGTTVTGEARCSPDSSNETQEATPTPSGLERDIPGSTFANLSSRFEWKRDTNGVTVLATDSVAAKESSSGIPTARGPVHHDRMFCRCVARLGADAADALDHAHGLGIIHRDIKPANLLIDCNGAVWITDFGLARFHSDLSLTGTGDVVGTLRYMSPEQALARRGVVDQRTDVYALGVTLYEMLTLRPAFDGRDHQELLRQIAIDEPIRPRRLNPAIPRDLETIVLKAMAKDVSSRYATAQEMAGDLRRHLDDQPIVARRPGPLECGWRWARRHGKQLASAAAIVVISLVITTAVSWRFYASTREAQHRYLDYFIKSFPLLDRFAMGQVEQAGTLLRGSTDPTTRERANQKFDQVLTIFQEASQLPPTDKQSRVIIARAFCHLAYTHICMSFYNGTWDHPEPTLLAKAFSDYSRSIDLFEKILAESGGDTTPRRYLADALGLNGMGCFFRLTSKREEAEQFYSRAIELRRDLIRGIGSPSVIAARPRIEVTGERGRPPLIVIYGSHLDLHDGRGGPDGGCGAVAPSNRRRFQSGGDEASYAGVSRASEDVGRPSHQGEFHLPASRILDCRLAIILDPKCAEAHNNLAWIQARFPDDTSFDPEQAFISARKAVELNPSNWFYLNTLGVAAFRVGDWKTAEQYLQKSIGFNGGKAVDWFFLAMTRWHQGKRKEARQWFDQAVSWIARNTSDDELRRFHAEAAELLGLPGPESKPSTREVEKTRRHVAPEMRIKL